MEFDRLTEIERTDFLNCLVIMAAILEEESDQQIDLNGLVLFLERLEPWDLELALTSLSLQPAQADYDTLESFCGEEQDASIREAAKQALRSRKEFLMSWFHRRPKRNGTRRLKARPASARLTYSTGEVEKVSRLRDFAEKPRRGVDEERRREVL